MFVDILLIDFMCSTTHSLLCVSKKQSYERLNIADALQTRAFEDGATILRQGDGGDCMYFVESGEVRITAYADSDSSTDREISVLRKGEYFGGTYFTPLTFYSVLLCVVS